MIYIINSDLSQCGEVDLLHLFLGTTATTVTVPDLSQYKLLILAVYTQVADANSVFEGSISVPSSTFYTGLTTMKAYGSSNSMWASCEAVDNTTVILNRTSANTSGVRLFGVK